MNPFYIIGMLFFASYCSVQTGQTNLTVNIDYENMVQCETHMQVHEITYIWTIRNFSAHERLAEELLSPKLRALTTDRIEWDLRLQLNGWCPGNKYAVRFNVFISSESIVRKAIADCNVSIINYKKEVLFHKKMISKRCYPVPEDRWERNYEDLRDKDDYFRNHLLQNDTLTMLFHIKWFFEPTNDVSLQPKIPSPRPTPDTAIMKNNLSANFEYMLENPEFADVLFITKYGVNYPAHKCILTARSPVFAAMFRRKDTKNGKNKKIRINVTNMDGEVLRSMLRYIYTGECENSDKLADKLLAAAIKYRLDGLRRICEQTLRQNSSSDTAA